MLACDAIRAAVQAVVAVALLTDAMEIWMFVVTSAVFGAAQAFFGPASTGLVPETISDARLQQANALLKVSEGSAYIVGPALSGFLVHVLPRLGLRVRLGEPSQARSSWRGCD